MSKAYDEFKKADDKAGGGPAGGKEAKNLEISDMKRQILERLREKRESAAGSQAPAIDREYTLGAVKKSAGANEPPSDIQPDEANDIVKKDSGLISKYEELKAELSRKNAAIQDFEKRLQGERDRTSASLEMLKGGDKRLVNADKLVRELEGAKKLIDEQRVRHESLETEHKKISRDRDEAAKMLRTLRSEIDMKEKAIQSLQKKAERVNELEEALRARDSKLADIDKLSRKLEEPKAFTDEQRARHESLEIEHKKVSRDRDEAAKMLRTLRSEIDMKEKAIQNLQKKVERLNELEDALRVRDSRISEADRLSKELEAAKKLNEEYRMKFESAKAEAKRLSEMNNEVAGHHGKLKDELGQRDAFVQDLQKKFTTEIHEITKERDRIASNVESLRSKLYTATKETKEQIARIAQLEEASRSKDKRILELDKLHAELGAVKSDIELKLRASENDNKDLSEKYARFNDELGSGRARVEQAEKSYREMEASHNGTNLQLQASLRGKKDIEAKAEQMRLELGAKASRLAETDRLYNELDVTARDLTLKLQTSQRRTKELEASNTDLALQLAGAERDNKIIKTRMSELESESEAKTMRLESSDKLHKELEAAVKDNSAKLQASQRKADELEKETAALSESLKTAPVKLKEAEAAAKNEIERLGAETASLKNIVKQKEKSEFEFRSLIENLESEMQARDAKIEGDLKYSEKIVKEINELRKKLSSLERQPERGKSAGS